MPYRSPAKHYGYGVAPAPGDATCPAAEAGAMTWTYGSSGAATATSCRSGEGSAPLRTCGPGTRGWPQTRLGLASCRDMLANSLIICRSRPYVDVPGEQITKPLRTFSYSLCLESYARLLVSTSFLIQSSSL